MCSDKILDEAYVYLFHRNASRLKFMQYARWRCTLKWHFTEATNDEIRAIFAGLKRRGHMIARKLTPRTHASYLFTQTSTNELTPEEVEARVAKATQVSTHVTF